MPENQRARSAPHHLDIAQDLLSLLESWAFRCAESDPDDEAYAGAGRLIHEVQRHLRIVQHAGTKKDTREPEEAKQ